MPVVHHSITIIERSTDAQERRRLPDEGPDDNNGKNLVKATHTHNHKVDHDDKNESSNNEKKIQDDKNVKKKGTKHSAKAGTKQSTKEGTEDLAKAATKHSSGAGKSHTNREGEPVKNDADEQGDVGEHKADAQSTKPPHPKPGDNKPGVHRSGDNKQGNRRHHNNNNKPNQRPVKETNQPDTTTYRLKIDGNDLKENDHGSVQKAFEDAVKKGNLEGVDTNPCKFMKVVLCDFTATSKVKDTTLSDIKESFEAAMKNKGFELNAELLTPLHRDGTGHGKKRGGKKKKQSKQQNGDQKSSSTNTAIGAIIIFLLLGLTVFLSFCRFPLIAHILHPVFTSCFVVWARTTDCFCLSVLVQEKTRDCRI